MTADTAARLVENDRIQRLELCAPLPRLPGAPGAEREYARQTRDRAGRSADVRAAQRWPAARLLSLRISA